MTSLRTASLASSLALSLALTGCPGDPAQPDAFAGLDGCACVDGGPSSTPDSPNLELPDAPSVEVPDAPSMSDAPSPDDSGPVVGDSFVARTCGPADGAALTITISDALDVPSCSADPERPSTSFYIHDLGGATLPPTAGATITSTTAASNGTGSVCPGGRPPCRVSETWSVTFTSYADDGAASGQYAITFEDGAMSTGTFQATRCEVGGRICG
ncbi:MAG: hypothetical protein J0L92_10895 [Deltaproteobacteria bacterium]|nr:hypothetical protein [Deltaproteobacteria bacterium]